MLGAGPEGATLRGMRSVHTPAYKAFLVRLVAARHRLGLTQRDVALALGRPHSWVAKVESGERRLDVIELSELATLYKRSLGWFVGKGKR